MAVEVEARFIALMSKLFHLLEAVIVHSTLEVFSADFAQGQ